MEPNESKQSTSSSQLSLLVRDAIDVYVLILQSCLGDNINSNTQDFFNAIKQAIINEAEKERGHNLSDSNENAKMRFKDAVISAHNALSGGESIAPAVANLMATEIGHLNADREQVRKQFAAQSAAGLTYQQRLYLKNCGDIKAEAVNEVNRSNFYDSEALLILLKALRLDQSETHGFCFYDNTMASGKAQFFNEAAQGKNHLVVFECVDGNHWTVKLYRNANGTVAQEPTADYNPSGAGSACGVRACVKACEWANIQQTPQWDITDDGDYPRLRSLIDDILLEDANNTLGFDARARQLFATQSEGRSQHVPASLRSPQPSLNDDQKQSILRQLYNQVLVDQKEFTTRKMLSGYSLAKLFTAKISLQSQIFTMLCCRTIAPCLGTGKSVLERYVSAFGSSLLSKPTLPEIEDFTKVVVGLALQNAFKTDNDYKLRFQQSSKNQRDYFRRACFNEIRFFLTLLVSNYGLDSNPDGFNITIPPLGNEFLEFVKESFEEKADKIFGPSALMHETLDEKRQPVSSSKLSL